MSGNIFDNLAANTFDTTANIMGYVCVWTPLAGGTTQTTRVLLNKPTEKREMLRNDDFNPFDYWIEYKDSDFLGLKASVDQNKPEVILVDGTDNYYVRSVVAKFDGKTLKAFLEPKNS